MEPIMLTPDQTQEEILALCFPETGHQNDPETHGAFWNTRMQGGMDATIIARFGEVTLAGATGALDGWVATPRGRLALLIVLDQFPRSLWRDTPAAYAQDIKAARLALAGIANGDFDALAPWEQAFFIIAISHCEGPDHLERLKGLDSVVEGIIDRLPAPIAGVGDVFRNQHLRVKGIIARFGRHPHRNEILGRASTPEELLYVREGVFPHNSEGLAETP